MAGKVQGSRQRVNEPKPTQTGPGVDRAGAPVPDPTANVLALVDAAVRRLDDLREAETGKREAISRQLFEIIELRAVHAQQLREAEAKRIDAIRAVDVMAASVDRERSAEAAKILAGQVATSADVLRALVASTAAQMNDRVSSLEKSAYEGAGKGGGQASLMGWIFTAIATVVAVGSLIVLATR